VRTDIPAKTDAVWRSGDFTGANRPARRVTIQRPQMRRESYQMRSTFRRVPAQTSDITSFNPYPAGIDPTKGEDVTNIYNDYLFTAPAKPLEFGGVQSIQWTRTTDIDTAECTVDFKNSVPMPVGLPAQNSDLDLPGFYTPGRGRSSFSSRWNHSPNPFADLMQPDNIIRTYEGYGCDMSVPPERDPNLTLTGVWIIDDVRPNARGGLTVVARDPGRLLLDHQNWLPVIPDDFYPTSWKNWDDKFTVNRRETNVERLAVTPVGSGNDRWPESAYVGARVYGHSHTDAFDGNMASYYLSVGNGQVGWRSAYEYVDFAVDHATVNEVRFWTVKSGYNAYISVKVNGSWVPGRAMPYHQDGRGRYDMGVPYVASAGGLAGEGEHVIQLGGIKDVTLIRLWLGHLQDFGLPGAKYRAGIREISAYGPVTRTVARQVALTQGPAGSNPGRCADFTDIIKLLCAWGGLFWPSNGYAWHSDGTKRNLRPQKPDTGVLGKAVQGRVWGDFQATGTNPPNEIIASTFDKKTLMDGVRYIADMVGFLFYFDETGAAQWRMPNVWTLGNWVTGLSGTPGRTSKILTIDERQTLTELQADVTSRYVREGVFVANPVGKYAAVVGGYNPNPTGLMRVAGWTDQNFASVEEARVMADLIAVRHLFRYRTDRVRIPAHPGLQIDDQVRIFERVTSEGFVHYVKGITSTNSASDGKWEYTLQTHWLGDNPNGRWIIDKSTLSSITARYVDSLQGGMEQVRNGLEV
jgi:hypothetical protein